MNAQTEKYLWAWKQSNIPDEVIATKLSLTVDQVKEHYQLMVMAATRQQDGTLDVLGTEFNLLCLQFQQLGERLKVLGAALGNFATAGEIAMTLKESKTESTMALMDRFIVLNPLTEKDVENIQQQNPLS